MESMGPEPTVTKSGEEPKPTQKTGPIKVGFTPTAMNTHYEVVIAGAKTAIDELGGASVIDMVIQAPSSQSGSAEQMNIVEGWVQQGFDAIAVCSSNDQAMTPIYKKAAEKGIPVFLFNDAGPMSVNPYYVSTVGYDQDEAGRIMGLWLVQQLRRQANQPGHPRRPARRPQHQPPARLPQGDRRHPNIKIVASQPADWVREKAQAVMENMLTATPTSSRVGHVRRDGPGWAGRDQGPRHGRQDPIMGYDNTPDAYQAIKRGEMTSRSTPRPRKWATT